MGERKKSATSIAKNNLKSGLQSPGAKIFLIILGIVILIGGGISASILSKTTSQAGGTAQGSGYGIEAKTPTGGVSDTATVRNIEERSNSRAEAALSSGGSYVGGFVFETEKVPQLNIKDGFNENSPDGKDSRYTEDEVMGALRKHAAELDRTEKRQVQSTRNASSNRSTSQAGRHDYSSEYSQPEAYADRSYVDAQGKPMPYALSGEDFKSIAGQLIEVGQGNVVYASLADGSLKSPNKQATEPSKPHLITAQSQNQSQSSGRTEGTTTGSQTTTLVNKRTAAVAGHICPVNAESTIDTDYAIPAFFEILNCGELTGVRVRGKIEKGPSDFVVKFDDYFTTPDHKFKIVTKAEGISVNIDKDGGAGVAQSVDNHWLTRLGSAAILSLARTEKEFISARGSSVISTGTSTSTTVEPLSDEEKNNARIAGLLEGSMDVITRDTQYGVNRQPTMERKRNTVIGLQFLSNLEIADL